MFIDCKEHIIGDFKLSPNLYENENKFTVYYQSFIIGTLYTTDKPYQLSSGSNSTLVFNILNNGAPVGTVTVTCNTVFTFFNAIQKYRISTISINPNFLDDIKENLIVPRKVLFEKTYLFDPSLHFDPLNKKLLNTYAKKAINRDFYSFINIDYLHKLR